MKNRLSFGLVSWTTIIILLLLTVSVVSADMMDMDGQHGNVTQDTVMRQGANSCYDSVAPVAANEPIMVLAQNNDGSWIFIWSEAGDGWVRTGAVNSDGDVAELPIWKDHFDGATCDNPAETISSSEYDAKICGTVGNIRAANTVRWTDIYSTADADFPTGNAYQPNVPLELIGRDFWGCWVQVRSVTTGKNGWVPVQAIDQRAILGLPILVDNSDGCVMENGKIVSCDNSDESVREVVRVRRANQNLVIYTQPNESFPSGRTIPIDGRLRIVSTRAGWLQITSRFGNGWIKENGLQPYNPTDAKVTILRDSSLYSDPNYESAIIGTATAGQSTTIIGFAPSWFKISNNGVEGWIPTRNVNK